MSVVRDSCTDIVGGDKHRRTILREVYRLTIVPVHSCRQKALPARTITDYDRTQCSPQGRLRWPWSSRVSSRPPSSLLGPSTVSEQRSISDSPTRAMSALIAFGVMEAPRSCRVVLLTKRVHYSSRTNKSKQAVRCRKHLADTKPQAAD